jgi:hypothetical protein
LIAARDKLVLKSSWRLFRFEKLRARKVASQAVSNHETAMAMALDLSAAITCHYIADAALDDLDKAFRAQETVKQLFRSTPSFATPRYKGVRFSYVRLELKHPCQMTLEKYLAEVISRAVSSQ